MILPLKNGYLRQAVKSDAVTLAKWWADGSVMEHAGFPHGLKTDVPKLASRLETQKPEDVLWIIEDCHHLPIGEMAYKINDQTATIGIKICETMKQGQGIGKSALKSLIMFLFEHFDITKIWLDTMIENTRAQHVYSSLYFQKTKVNKDHWTDQLGQKRTSVEFELSRDTYTNHQTFFQNH